MSKKLGKIPSKLPIELTCHILRPSGSFPDDWYAGISRSGRIPRYGKRYKTKCCFYMVQLRPYRYSTGGFGNNSPILYRMGLFLTTEIVETVEKPK